jgi:hypothetical protein
VGQKAMWYMMKGVFKEGDPLPYYCLREYRVVSTFMMGF